jgi:hypothetical protein
VTWLPSNILTCSATILKTFANAANPPFAAMDRPQVPVRPTLMAVEANGTHLRTTLTSTSLVS